MSALLDTACFRGLELPRTASLPLFHRAATYICMTPVQLGILERQHTAPPQVKKLCLGKSFWRCGVSVSSSEKLENVQLIHFACFPISTETTTDRFALLASLEPFCSEISLDT